MEKFKVSNDAANTHSDTDQSNVSTQDTEVFAAVSTPEKAVPVDSIETNAAETPSEPRKNLDLFPVKGIEQIIARKLETVPGVVSVDAKLAGLGGRAFPRVLAQLDPIKKVAAVEAVVAVSWPSPVTEVAASCRNAIRETITAYLGYETTRANIVVGHAVAGKRVTSAEVKARPLITARSPRTTETQVAQPKINRKTTVHNVALLGDPVVSNVAPPAEPNVESITVPDAPEVRSIKTPDPRSLQAVSTRTMVEIRGIQTPRARTVEPVSIQNPLALKAVKTPAEVVVTHVKQPKEEKLSQVSYQQADVFSPQAPEQIELKSVSTPPAYSVEVTPPQPAALKKISVNELGSRQVRAPEPKRLREITVNATPLAEININRVAPVKHVYVPEPTPLRYISVSPDNVSKQKKKG